MPNDPSKKTIKFIESTDSLPIVGKQSVLYIVMETQSGYLWNGTGYDVFGGGGESQIVWVDDYASLPIIGVVDILYVTKDDNKGYTWDGSVYQLFGGGSLTPMYYELTKEDFDILIANNSLISGATYVVSGAHWCEQLNQLFTIQCTAATVNSVSPACFIISTPTMICYWEPDSLFQLQGATATIPLNAALVLAWGSFNPEVMPGGDIYIAPNAGTLLKTSVSDDSTVLRLTNVIDLITGSFGTYDPNTDTFTPNP